MKKKLQQCEHQRLASVIVPCGAAMEIAGTVREFKERLSLKRRQLEALVKAP